MTKDKATIKPTSPPLVCYRHRWQQTYEDTLRFWTCIKCGVTIERMFMELKTSD